MELSQEVYSLLTKRKYNRGKPYLADQLISTINDAISQNNPIQLVGFWGTGPKSKPNKADHESCAFLNKLNEEIRRVYIPGIEFTFILANSHGLHNGYEERNINSYIQGMIEIFNSYAFNYILLDKLWNKYHISFEKIESVFDTQPKGWWDTITQRATIEKNALHRNKKYSPKEAAQKYYIMRELEKEMLQKEFKGYIFHAFSDPRLQIVLPVMPTLYFYGKESWSNAPWFVVD